MQSEAGSLPKAEALNEIFFFFRRSDQRASGNDAIRHLGIVFVGNRVESNETVRDQQARRYTRSFLVPFRGGKIDQPDQTIVSRLARENNVFQRRPWRFERSPAWAKNADKKLMKPRESGFSFCVWSESHRRERSIIVNTAFLTGGSRGQIFRIDFIGADYAFLNSRLNGVRSHRRGWIADRRVTKLTDYADRRNKTWRKRTPSRKIMPRARREQWALMKR